MEINVLKIIGKKESYLIKTGTIGSGKYLLNGYEVSDLLKNNDLVIAGDDKFEYLSSSRVLIDYKKGNKTISKEDYRSRSQYYDEDSTDEETLRAIANKKELKGFEARYEEPKPEMVLCKIVGIVEDTGSRFISCTITNRYNKVPLLYTIYPKKDSMDEYNLLAEKYSSEANFQEPDRPYLRFVKVNKNYIFGDCYPFGDYSYKKSSMYLKDIQEEEVNIRKLVRERVEKEVFCKNLTEIKATQILSQLRTIEKIKTRKSMAESIAILIGDNKAQLAAEIIKYFLVAIYSTLSL